MDATFGGGGHTRALLEACAPDGRVIALDRDPDAIAHGAALVAAESGRLQLVRRPFGELGAVLTELGTPAIHGALFDLGVSSHQLDRPERGFSFQSDGPLDMRMDPTSGPAAADLVNGETAERLAEIFFRYGDERHSRRIARAIVMDRQRMPFTTTRQLAEMIARVMPGPPQRIHPATRCFQALRIAVNGELEQLEQGLDAAMAALRPGGRVAVISFHSLEDRLVKNRFRDAAHPPTPEGPAAWQLPPAVPGFRLVTRKPLVADAAEVAANPRARSARLRIVERLAVEAGP